MHVEVCSLAPSKSCCHGNHVIERVFIHSTCITPSKEIDQTDPSSTGAKGIANETSESF